MLHRRKILPIALLAVGLLLGGGGSTLGGAAAFAGPSQASPSASGAAPADTGRHLVTLITGDRVLVTGRGRAPVITHGPGRQHIPVITRSIKGDLYVLPEDALRQIQSGKVDRRLFDVSELIRLGYDDRSTSSLPLIVQYRTDAVRPNLAAGTRVTRSLPDIRGAALAAAKSNAGAAWNALPGTVQHLWLDGKRRIALDQSVPQIGAPAAWAAGYTGKGVTVAVLDTGIDATHPDLAGKVVEEHNFTDDPNPADTVGHGTHVASTIAGTGAASGGKYKGVAPDATLYDGKVCADEFCDDSAILAGLQWAAADKHAVAVNLSLGGGDTPDIDPLEAAVNTLTAQYHTLFVIAAGNDGEFGDYTVGSPGSADAALTVGAVDKSDVLASFSSRGPRVGDDAVKPDITAPGVNIVAARAAGTTLDQPVDQYYVRASGTSMATPHVTGSVALLAQQHPDWTADQFKATLMASAKADPTLTAFAQGAGREDVARAITQTVTASPASLSYGRQQWPHTDDTPVTKTVTLTNDGATDTTLAVNPHIIGPGGAATPAGLVTTSAGSVTVPAHGTASLDVTVDTRVAGPDGLYSGELVLTGGTTEVNIPLGVNKEVESYTLTVKTIDGTGAPTGAYWIVLSDLSSAIGTEYMPWDASGTVSIRLPKGQYDMFNVIDTGDDDPATATVAEWVQPVLDLTADTTITTDARDTKPVVLSVPAKEATVGSVDVGYTHTGPAWTTGLDVISDRFNVTSTRAGRALTAAEGGGQVSAMWGVVDADGSFGNSPYLYVVNQPVPGGPPDGYSRAYRPGDLATIRASYRAQAPGDYGIVLYSTVNGNSSSGIGLIRPLPSTLTWFVNTALPGYGEVDAGPLDDGFPDLTTAYTGSPIRLRPGHVYRDDFGRPAFGPAFPAQLFAGGYVGRFGDEIDAEPPMFSDTAGHAGYSVLTSGKTALYRDGVLLSEFDGGFGFWEVPADPASYTLTTTQDRTVGGGFTTSVSSTWTFTSGHVDTTTPVALPLQAVRFTPALSADGAARAGWFTFPVSVQRQAGTARVKSLRVQVSYDDGKTWQPVILHRAGDHWLATVHQPGSGYVSLHAAAVDSAGGTVDQTVIHAYALTG